MVEVLLLFNLFALITIAMLLYIGFRTLFMISRGVRSLIPAYWVLRKVWRALA